MITGPCRCQQANGRAVPVGLKTGSRGVPLCASVSTVEVD